VPLTAIAIAKKTTPGRYSDGNSLYLLVKKDGRKYWLFRYRDRTTQKLRDKGLGPVADLSLSAARNKAQEYRALLRDGKDPIDETKRLRQDAKAAKGQLVTFGFCATNCIDAIKHEWRNEKSAAQWTATIDTYCAALKPLPVASIDVGLVHKVLLPIWKTKTETATRLRGRMERILDWASAKGYRSGDNPASLRGSLKSLLPSASKLKNVKHRPALPHIEIADFVSELIDKDCVSSSALQLQLLTATRPNEALGARWSEFDIKAKTWTIPKERMKAGRDHKIPLANQTLRLIKALPKQNPTLLFPGPKDRAITSAATLKLLKELRPGMTCHGFRSTFRDWAAEVTSHPREAAEMALAHVLKDKTESAYFRSDLLDKRVTLMQDWADYCYSK